MVDKLKRSLEQLDAPLCSDCQAKMNWTRSTLVGVEPAEIIHVFSCPDCQEMVETKTVVGLDSASTA